MVKANVDLILDYLKLKKNASVPEIAKATKIKQEDVLKSVEYLEEDGLVKIDYKLTTPYVILVEKKDENQIDNFIDNKEKTKENINNISNISQSSNNLKNQQIGQTQIRESSFLITDPINKNEVNEKKVEERINLNIIYPNLTQSSENSNFVKLSYNNLDLSNNPIKNNNINDQKITYLNNDLLNINEKNEILQKTPIKINNQDNTNKILIDKDPFDEKPFFNLETPEIKEKKEDNQKYEKIQNILFEKNIEIDKSKIEENKIDLLKNQNILKPKLEYESEYDFNIPEYLQKDSEKIDFLIEFGIKKIENYDYKDLNSLYRKIYNIFKYSNELSTNERYLLSEKINDLFNRIKRIYMIEESAV